MSVGIKLPHRTATPVDEKVYPPSQPVEIRDGGTYYPEIPDGLPRYIDVPNTEFVWDYQQAEWRSRDSVDEAQVGDWPTQYTDLIIIDGSTLTDIINGIVPPAPYDPNRVHVSMHWRNNWSDSPYGGDYHSGDVVKDGNWTMIANKDTEDRAAPIDNDDQAYDLPSPTFLTGNYTGVVHSGREWITNQPIKVVGYQVYIPTLTPDTNYVIRAYSYPVGDPDSIVYTQIPELVYTEDDWTTVAINQSIFGPNMVIGVLIDALNSGSDSTMVGGWTRGTNNNSSLIDPGSQAWATRNNFEHVRMSYLDADSVDRTSELQGVVPGSTIQIVNTNDSSESATWSVGASGTDYGTHIAFENVVLEDQGPNGMPDVLDICTITITIPVPSPTDYVYETGTNPSVPWASTKGYLALDGVDQSADADAFGVRALVSTFDVSPDWDIVSLTDLSSGGAPAKVFTVTPGINSVTIDYG